MDVLLVGASAATVLTALVVELRLFAPRREASTREALVWSIAWLSFAIAVSIGLGLATSIGGEWTTVYVIERSLSLDNLFLFLLILGYFGVPPELRGRVLAVGVLAALALRGIAIVVGVAVVEAVEVVIYGFGLLLVVVAVRAFRTGTGETDPLKSPILRGLVRILPVTDGFRGGRLLVDEGGRLYATPLLLTVLAIVAADIAFAIDSIPAAFSVTRDAAIIWTANAFALLGLRALLALVDDLVRRFRYLGKTIAVVLAFVGLKILLASVIAIGDLTTLLVIALFLGVGMIASLIADALDPPTRAEEVERRPPRCPRRLEPLPAAVPGTTRNRSG